MSEMKHLFADIKNFDPASTVLLYIIPMVDISLGDKNSPRRSAEGLLTPLVPRPVWQKNLLRLIGNLLLVC